MSLVRRISDFGCEALSAPVRILKGGDKRARNTAACARHAPCEGLTASIANGGLKLEIDNASAASIDGISLVRPSVENVLDWYMDGSQGVSLLDLQLSHENIMIHVPRVFVSCCTHLRLQGFQRKIRTGQNYGPQQSLSLR